MRREWQSDDDKVDDDKAKHDSYQIPTPPDMESAPVCGAMIAVHHVSRRYQGALVFLLNAQAPVLST